MRIFIIIMVALVYFLGLLTIQWLNNILPEHLKSHPFQHYTTLFIMWLFTPLMIVMFIFRIIFHNFMNHNGEEYHNGEE